MNLLDAIKSNVIFFDGGTGTELQKLEITHNPVVANITRPQAITGVHRAYLQAGANIVTANTFGAYSHKHDNFAEIIAAAMANARAAVAEVGPAWVVLDLGPTGLLPEPYGDVTVQEMADIFAKTIEAGAANGADAILIETMMDLNELEIAVTEAKKTGLPVFATMSFDPNGRTMYGASLQDMVQLLQGLQADALGINCGQGLAGYKNLVAELVQLTELPVIVQPNAGLPENEGGVAVYKLPPAEFAQFMSEIAGLGVKLLGGCCGTTPAHIAAVVEKVRPPRKLSEACENISESGSIFARLNEFPERSTNRI